MLRAPHELVFGGVGRVSDAVALRSSLSSSTRNARALQSIDRTARRAPQVVVKITSRIHGAGSTAGAMTYAGRVGMSDREPIGIDTSEGKHLVSAHDMLLLAREWQQWEQADEARRKGATAIAMVFSMPPGTDPEGVRDAVRELADCDMANRRWVMALHTDEAHPHVHLIIAGRDNDGRRFNPDRAFLQHCRERFAENLRVRGIEADATKRQARGYPPKSDPAPVVQMRARGVVPVADKGRAAMIADQANADAQLAKRQQARARTAANIVAVRGVYQRAIAELEAHGGHQETQRAKALRAFVRALPDALDARTEIIERLKPGKAEPRARDGAAENRAGAIDRLERVAARIRSSAAERKPDEAGQGSAHTAATDRLRAKTAALKNKPEPNETREAAAARARLETMQRMVDEAVKDRERGKDHDRERGRDKDRGGPGR